MLIIELLSQPFWYRLGLTLTHFLWQGLVVAILAGTVIRLFKLSPGNTRYAAYLLAFIVVAICPVITFVVIDASVEPVTRAPATEAEAHAPFGAIPHPILPVDNTSLMRKTRRAILFFMWRPYWLVHGSQRIFLPRART